MAYCYTKLAVPSLAVVIRLSPVLLSPTHKGMARLSWSGWLVKCQDSIPAVPQIMRQRKLSATAALTLQL